MPQLYPDCIAAQALQRGEASVAIEQHQRTGLDQEARLETEITKLCSGGSDQVSTGGTNAMSSKAHFHVIARQEFELSREMGGYVDGQAKELDALRV